MSLDSRQWIPTQKGAANADLWPRLRRADPVPNVVPHPPAPSRSTQCPKPPLLGNLRDLDLLAFFPSRGRFTEV